MAMEIMGLSMLCFIRIRVKLLKEMPLLILSFLYKEVAEKSLVKLR